MKISNIIRFYIALLISGFFWFGLNYDNPVNSTFETQQHDTIGFSWKNPWNSELPLILTIGWMFGQSVYALCWATVTQRIKKSIMLKTKMQVGAIFEKIEISNFFMWTTLNINVMSKMEKRTGDIFNGTLDIEFERDWSIGLGAALINGHTEK